MNNNQPLHDDEKWKDAFSKLNQWDEHVSDSTWESISDQLDRPKRKRVIYYYMLVAILLMSVGIWYYMQATITLKNTQNSDQGAKSTLSNQIDIDSVSLITRHQSNQNTSIQNKNHEASVVATTKEKQKATHVLSKFIGQEFNATDFSKSQKSTIKIAENAKMSLPVEKNIQQVIESELTIKDVDESISVINYQQKEVDLLHDQVLLPELLGKLVIPDLALEMEESQQTNELTSKNSVWRIASYTGVGLTYHHFKANSRDKHFIKVIDAEKNFSDRQNLTFGIAAQRQWKQKWNMHLDFSVSKWNNVVSYEPIRNYYLPPTEYQGVRVSAHKVLVSPVFKLRDTLLIQQQVNYESMYASFELGFSYNLHQTHRWTHKIGAQLGLMSLMNDKINYYYQQTLDNEPLQSLPLTYTISSFYQNEVNISKKWQIISRVNAKYMPYLIGNNESAWKMRFMQFNAHIGIQYKF